MELLDDNLHGKLAWFLKNLEFLIEDLKLEEDKVQIDLYLDTLDIIHAVLGYERFYKAGTFKVQELFKTDPDKPLKDRLIALCLASSGRLGTLKMLPPHQAEFLDSLNQEFGFQDTVVTPEPREFLKAVSKIASIKKEASSLKDLKETDDETTIEYVQEHVGSAVKFFQIIQLIRGISWRARFLNLKHGILDLSGEEPDYQKILESHEFKTFHKCFSENRKRKSRANFVDAVALTMLAEQVERLRAGEPNPVPRFHVFSEKKGKEPLFLDVLKDSKLENKLKYGESNHSVLRESDYFVFKSIFHRPKGSTNGGPSPNSAHREELLKLRDDVMSIVENHEYIEKKQLAHISFAGKNVTELIDELNNFYFFQNVWLPSAEPETDLAIKDLKEAAKELKSEDFKQTVGIGIDEAKKTLEKNVERFQLLREMWEEIEAATKSLPQELAEKPIDYSRDLGLLRFSFPDSSYDRINQVLNDVLHAKDGGQLTLSNVIAACYMAHLLSREKYIDDVAAASAVLWAGERHRELIKLLTQLAPLPHYSLELILAAATFESPEHSESGKVILDQLEKKFNETSRESEERSNLAVGLAYLNFHYWRVLGNGPPWDREPNESTTNHKHLIDRAIDLALEAYKTLGDRDMRKKVYALNQYVYYMIMADDPNLSDEINSNLDTLLWYREQGNRDWWQHRFDDTIARYYRSLDHRAELAGNHDKQTFYLSKAIEYAKAAGERGNWDRAVKAFRDRLLNRWNESSES